MKNIAIVLAATIGLAAAGFFGTVAVIRSRSSPSGNLATAIDSAMSRQNKGLAGAAVGALVGLAGSVFFVRRGGG